MTSCWRADVSKKINGRYAKCTNRRAGVQLFVMKQCEIGKLVDEHENTGSTMTKKFLFAHEKSMCAEGFSVMAENASVVETRRRKLYSQTNAFYFERKISYVLINVTRKRANLVHIHNDKVKLVKQSTHKSRPKCLAYPPCP